MLQFFLYKESFNDIHAMIVRHLHYLLMQIYYTNAPNIKSCLSIMLHQNITFFITSSYRYVTTYIVRWGVVVCDKGSINHFSFTKTNLLQRHGVRIQRHLPRARGQEFRFVGGNSVDSFQRHSISCF